VWPGAPLCPRPGAWTCPRCGPAPAHSPALAHSPRPVPARPPLPAHPRRCGPAARPSRRVLGTARSWFGVVGPRCGPAACSRRVARHVHSSAPACTRLVRGASARPCARAACSRRVSAALRARVLACCAQCFGVARRALDATRSVLSRVTCSSTPVFYA
jgi:hypothetical protein